jgi:hypothetical protein
MPELPSSVHLSVHIPPFSSALLPRCQCSEHQGNLDGKHFFPFSNAVTQINESRWKPLMKRYRKSTCLQCRIAAQGMMLHQD